MKITDNMVKYPRTPHIPGSPGATSDDRLLDSVDHFVGRRVVVTEKLDGENTTIWSGGHSHARSLDSGRHESRSMLRSEAARVGLDLPEGWRVCGENTYAEHSISYSALPSYFVVFSIWNEKNEALSWDETVEWCALLGLNHVPVLFDGIWDETAVRACYTGVSRFGGKQEGYVVRMADGFHYDEFDRNLAKFVRAGHVQTDQHWSQKAVTPNKLATV
jgi:hypothetical protein